MDPSKDLKFYNTPNEVCSCRDENGDFMPISRRFREYYERIKEGEKPVDILKTFKDIKICCRAKFLSVPLQPMIDRSSRRFSDETQRNSIKEDTRRLGFKIDPPDFPLL